MFPWLTNFCRNVTSDVTSRELCIYVVHHVGRRKALATSLGVAPGVLAAAPISSKPSHYLWLLLLLSGSDGASTLPDPRACPLHRS